MSLIKSLKEQFKINSYLRVFVYSSTTWKVFWFVYWVIFPGLVLFDYYNYTKTGEFFIFQTIVKVVWGDNNFHLEKFRVTYIIGFMFFGLICYKWKVRVEKENIKLEMKKDDLKLKENSN
jgi:hypothetical protein